MIFGLLAILVGFTAFCVLAYTCAIYALPVLAGFATGYWALQSGAGVIGGILAGFVIGGITWAVGQIAFADARRPLTRMMIALAFVAPAAAIAYHMILDLSAYGITSPIWSHAIAVFGALIVGTTAFARLTSPTEERFAALRD